MEDKYGLVNLDDRLQRRREEEESSLRELEEYVNKQILRSAMRDNGMSTLDVEVTSYYELLTDDNVNDISYKETRRELENNGVDVDRLVSNFVSYQTVRTHLNECLDISTSKEYTPDIAKDRDRFIGLKQRVEDVVERALNRLHKHDALHIPEPEVNTSIRVRCGKCGDVYDVFQFLDEEACSCPQKQKDESEGVDKEAAEEPVNLVTANEVGGRKEETQDDDGELKLTKFVK